eukprot:TRINITY_DN5098_c0_g2_i2.p1 TRINITY_DN5098_c0_g2~~TRINITY_DN5098_c0_g2_i2.p1  ORF type:complete len:581 (+),score=148.27 TRINITY_DN5098_c0_g2_i2:138-1745(+)
MNKLGFMLFVAVICLSSLNALFLYNAKNDEGDFDFDSTTIPLNTETLKLLLSGYMIFRAFKEKDPSVTNYKWSFVESLKFMVPALIYAINNNMVLFAYLYLNPVHVVPLNNFKMIWTCVLWRIFFKKKISNLKLVALAILIVGCLITQQEPCPDPTEQTESLRETVEESTVSENPDEGVKEGEASHKATKGKLHGPDSSTSKKKRDDDEQDEDDQHENERSENTHDVNVDIAHPGDGKLDLVAGTEKRMLSVSQTPATKKPVGFLPGASLLHALDMVTNAWVSRVSIPIDSDIQDAAARQLMGVGGKDKKTTATAGSKKDKTKNSDERKSNPPKDTRWIGVTLVMLETFLSAMAGVYTEALMKKGASDSIHIQNFQLYAYGVLVTSIFYQIQSGSSLTNRGYFEGYNIWSILYLFNTACGGLMISGLLKYVDNIAKIFSQSISVGVVTIMGIFFFNYKLNVFIIMGLVNISAAVWMYYVAADRILPDSIPTPEKSSAEDGQPQITTSSNGTVIPKNPEVVGDEKSNASPRTARNV